MQDGCYEPLGQKIRVAKAKSARPDLVLNAWTAIAPAAVASDAG